MTDPETQRTAGGVLGRVAGKAKELGGELTGNDDLAREGRLQQAQTEAEIRAQREAAEAEQRDREARLQEERDQAEVERRRLENELSAEEREAKAEQDRIEAERRAEADAAAQARAAEEQRAAENAAAQRTEQAAVGGRCGGEV